MASVRCRRWRHRCPACSLSAMSAPARSSASAARSARARKSWRRCTAFSPTARNRRYRDRSRRMPKGCSHIADIQDVTPSALGCEECLKTGSRWLHLRICRTCGHVGCCDDSPNKHATAHFHATGHPVIEGYDPPEGWGWCYVDEVLFDLSNRKTPHNGKIPCYY